mgnify:CR=1 FL=1
METPLLYLVVKDIVVIDWFKKMKNHNHHIHNNLYIRTTLCSLSLLQILDKIQTFFQVKF